MQTYVDINKAAQAKGETGPITSLSIWGLFDAPYLAETDEWSILRIIYRTVSAEGSLQRSVQSAFGRIMKKFQTVI